MKVMFYGLYSIYKYKKNHDHLSSSILFDLTSPASYFIKLGYRILFAFLGNEHLILSTIFTVK